MLRQFFLNNHPIFRLIFAAFAILACFSFVYLIGMLFSMLFFGSDLNSITQAVSDLQDPKNVAITRYFQIVYSLGFFAIPPLIIGYFFHGSTLHYLRLRRQPDGSILIMAIFLVLVMQPAINLIAVLNEVMLSKGIFSLSFESWIKGYEDSVSRQVTAFINSSGESSLIINLITIAVIPAIGEELLFRGILQRLFSELFKNVHVGIFLSAFLFSAIHMQFYGFFPRLLMGMMFGYLLVWSRSMWIPIIAHFINNSLIVVILFFVANNTLTKNIEHIGGTNDSFFVGIISLLFASGFLYLIFRKAKTVLI